ncbi:MAG: ABC transporter permease [Chloroflexota bacterium]
MTENNSQVEKPKKNSVAIFFSEITKGSWLIPVLAIFTGLVIGGLIVMFTTEGMYTSFGEGEVWEGLKIGFGAFTDSFEALFKGSVGDPAKISAALKSGDDLAIRRAFNPFLESLVAATPYIFAGLAVAIAFKCSMFNIGAEGQLYIGAIAATFVGYSVEGLPGYIHVPLALLAGAVGGALWGMVPGWLKAKTGAHEVINTIMMNYVAYRLSEYLLRGPMMREGYSPVSPFIQDSAKLFRFFKDPIRFHLGFFIALGVAWLVWWFLFRTKWGFELRTVGANPKAARYAGMNVPLTMVMAMALAGAMAGLAGANEVMGVNYFLAAAFSSGYGFDAIALALLGKSHPGGVVLAAILFGFLSNGAIKMQVMGIPVDIITIIQALVIIFVAAPAIVRTIYRLKEPEQGDEPLVLAASPGGD